MQASGTVAAKDIPHETNETAMDEYDSQSKLLQEFSKVPSIDKAWIFKSDSGVLTTFSWAVPGQCSRSVK